MLVTTTKTSSQRRLPEILLEVPGSADSAEIDQSLLGLRGAFCVTNFLVAFKIELVQVLAYPKLASF
jgi:hypothetical protein